ncbi:MAG: hypothetical protein R3Y56_05030 [Akkermansia sp.]
MSKKLLCWTIGLALYALLLVICYKAVYLSTSCVRYVIPPVFNLDEAQYMKNRPDYTYLEDEQVDIVRDLIARNEMYNISRQSSNHLLDLQNHIILSYDKKAATEGPSLARFVAMEQAEPDELSLMSRSCFNSMMGFRSFYHRDEQMLIKVPMVIDGECSEYDPKALVIVYEMVDGHLRSRELFIYDFPEKARSLELPIYDNDDDSELE